MSAALPPPVHLPKTLTRRLASSPSLPREAKRTPQLTTSKRYGSGCFRTRPCTRCRSCAMPACCPSKRGIRIRDRRCRPWRRVTGCGWLSTLRRCSSLVHVQSCAWRWLRAESRRRIQGVDAHREDRGSVIEFEVAGIQRRSSTCDAPSLPFCLHPSSSPTISRRTHVLMLTRISRAQHQSVGR